MSALFPRQDFVLPEYSDSAPEGGNPLAVDVNAQYAGLEFHYVYQIVMAFFVFMIVPGLGLLYGGMSQRKSALAMMFQSFAIIAVAVFQWMFWGFSLTFSRTSSSFIGNMDNFGLRGVMSAPSSGSVLIPDLVFCIYQMMFAIVAAAIVIGGAFDRGKIIPSLVFLFCWLTVVYNPIASWTWNSNGWAYNLGVLDFAGGSPVHMSTGAAGLAYALVLGKRKTVGDNFHHKPHNLTMMFLGTIFIFIGWLGFNGGSALNASMRSMVAVFNTVIGGSMGLVGYTVLAYFKYGRKWSVKAACEGIIAGLVGITPAAGYVQPWLAAVIGIITGLVCCSLEGLSHWVNIDDGLEVFKLHGIGGAVGSFLTGIFATSRISSLDGQGSEYSGAIDGNGIQVAYQLADICATLSYSFVVSCILLFALKYTPFVGLRVSHEAEEAGLDLDQFHDEVVGEWDDFAQLQGVRSRVGKGDHSSGITTPDAEGSRQGTLIPTQKEEIKGEA